MVFFVGSRPNEGA